MTGSEYLFAPAYRGHYTSKHFHLDMNCQNFTFGQKRKRGRVGSFLAAGMKPCPACGPLKPVAFALSGTQNGGRRVLHRSKSCRDLLKSNRRAKPLTAAQAAARNQEFCQSCQEEPTKPLLLNPGKQSGPP